jgi:hypothetical protein
MNINNLTSRLRLAKSSFAANREEERRRIKAATRALRTHAEKIAWHLAEIAQDRAASPGIHPQPSR